MQVVNLGSHVFELKFFLLHAQLIWVLLQSLLD
jgi:hypothetical protein